MGIDKHIDLETLARIIESIPSNIFFKDTDLKYVFSSHIWEQVDAGDDGEFDIYGKTDRDIRKDTANIDNVEKADRKIIETGEGTSYVIKSDVDGHSKYLELIKEPVRDKSDNIIGIVGLINDVTNVTEEMREMLENEKAYREAMKKGALLAFNVNLSQNLLVDELREVINGREVNLLDMIGMKAPCSYSDMIEKYAQVMLADDSREAFLAFNNTSKFIDLFKAGQRQVVKEFKLEINKSVSNQRQMWCYENVLLMKNTKDEIIAFFTINDISEQRKKEEEVRLQLEENVREAERIANMKSDFLANMSHEIRTPMNAVIGMAEMALREDLPESARDYINQIKTSGNALLNIINDILDFSKIESGKMDIIPDNYDPLSVIHDMSGVLMNRLADKDVELIANVNPMLPIGLFGDAMRLRQIVINLANNAIKFTQNGFVRTDVDFRKISDDEIAIKIDVVDSGIGIKEEDLNKLFVSFQQVDSKRNRNIEGTGLGLAICSRLVDLMGGKIGVSSEYGKGSTFSFFIPQKVTDWTPSLSIDDIDNKLIITHWEKGAILDQLELILNSLKVEHYSYDQIEEAKKEHPLSFENKKLYFITSNRLFTSELDEYANEHSECQFIVLCDWLMSIENTRANVMFIKKPISTIGIAMALNQKHYHAMGTELAEFDFVAPDAKVLIVDDNEVNLLVAEGLIEPLKMQVTTALSGKEALSLLENESFDIVLMDHMMPELDGVETTRIIRRLHPELDSMPIIALTANAVGGAKEMFFSEGMNDFLAKPIEIKAMTRIIRQWLPNEKIKKGIATDEGSTAPKEQEEKLVIGDLDVDEALSLIGNKKLYFSILEKYAASIKTKAEIIKNAEVTEDIKLYTIEVHALKSSSKQMGAMELSAMAKELEDCGNALDLATIHEKTDALLEKYTSYSAILDPLFETEDSSGANGEAKPAITKDILNAFLDEMLAAADELDLDAMEDIAKRMNGYSYEGSDIEYKKQIDEAVSNIAVDMIEEIAQSWKTA